MLILEALKCFRHKTYINFKNNLNGKYIDTAVLFSGMTTRRTFNQKGLAVKDITQYIKDNYHNSISVVDLAKHFKVTSKTLNRVLRSTLNISTKKLIIVTKLEKIKEILLKIGL